MLALPLLRIRELNLSLPRYTSTLTKLIESLQFSLQLPLPHLQSLHLESPQLSPLRLRLLTLRLLQPLLLPPLPLRVLHLPLPPRHLQLPVPQAMLHLLLVPLRQLPLRLLRALPAGHLQLLLQPALAVPLAQPAHARLSSPEQPILCLLREWLVLLWV